MISGTYLSELVISGTYLSELVISGTYLISGIMITFDKWHQDRLYLISGIMNISDIYRDALEKLPGPVGVLILLAVNWLFQGLLFADAEERLFKIMLEIMLIALFLNIFEGFIQADLLLLPAIIAAHSMNWLCATNIWSLRTGKSTHIIDISIAIQVLEDIEAKLTSRDYFYGAAVFGSMSTGNFNDKSDIDIKLFRRGGAKNFMLSYLFLTAARTEANIRKIPLDVYVVKGINSYSLKKGEVPLIIYDPDGLLQQSYRRCCAHF